MGLDGQLCSIFFPLVFSVFYTQRKRKEILRQGWNTPNSHQNIYMETLQKTNKNQLLTRDSPLIKVEQNCTSYIWKEGVVKTGGCLTSFYKLHYVIESGVIQQTQQCRKWKSCECGVCASSHMVFKVNVMQVKDAGLRAVRDWSPWVKDQYSMGSSCASFPHAHLC